MNISISNVHNSTVWKGSALRDKVTAFVPLSLWVCERNKPALSVGRVFNKWFDKWAKTYSLSGQAKKQLPAWEKFQQSRRVWKPLPDTQKRHCMNALDNSFYQSKWNKSFCSETQEWKQQRYTNRKWNKAPSHDQQICCYFLQVTGVGRIVRTTHEWTNQVRISLKMCFWLQDAKMHPEQEYLKPKI